ncbi:hypothetical protein quinque_001578 [Culex quinquefasciatus]
MAYNKDEMNAPKWMNEAFFEKVLQQSENDDSVKVTEFTTAPGSKPGDHFASIIFRAVVKFEGKGKSKDISLIVKTMPELEGIKKDLLQDGRLFATEATMYKTVLPEVHKTLRAVGDDTVLGPRLHYSSKDPLDYQLSCWGTPAIDIIYSLYQAVSVETRDNHRDQLIKFYYDEFENALKKFGHGQKIPSMMDLRVEITKCGHLEAFLATTFLPWFMLTPDELMPQICQSSETDIEIDLSSAEGWEKMADQKQTSFSRVMAYNKDEMNAPKWMDGAFFEKVLQQSENDDSVKVTEFTTAPGSKPGDHFASIIFRAVVKFVGQGKSKDISLIVKTLPELEGIKKDLLEDGRLFETEATMYKTVLPEVHKMLRAVGDDTVLGPRLHYSSKDPLDYQLSSWGSPAVDIIYSLYQAVSVETRDNHRDELIKFYYDEFATALKKFDYGPKIPSLIDLRVEITRCGHLESFLSTTFLPMFLLTPDEMVPQMVESSDKDIEIDLASVKAWENLSDRCFRHPKYAEAIKRYLPTFWGKGLLDV